MIKKKPTYLVCPLNWGLGHASRMIPVIKDLLAKNNSVFIGGDGMALELLKSEFPNLKFISAPDIHVTFDSRRKAFQLFIIAFNLIRSILKEHKILKTILKECRIDVVISDNRYGLWNKNIKSIIYTHQLMVKLPKVIKFLEYPVHCIIKVLLSRFDECRIPDYQNKTLSLAGDLTHKYKSPKNAVFVGPLSRFDINISSYQSPSHIYDVVIALSGPEPERGKLENQLLLRFKNSNYDTLLIRGITNSTNQQVRIINNITILDSIDSLQMQYYLLTAKYIICRSGYTSIMDLHKLNLEALLIPTPEQTEQEYLAKYHSDTKNPVYKNDLLFLSEFIS